MKTLRNSFLVFFVSLSILYGLWKYTSAQQQPAESNLLSISDKVQVRYTAPWAPSATTYSNAVELVVLRKTRIVGKQDNKEQEVEYAEARCLITIEPRTSHADALRRLLEIAAERDGSVTYREIGSWPGLELTFTEELQRRGKNPPPPSFAQQAITAVAAGDRLLRFEITLTPNADPGLLRDAQNIARDVRLQERGNSAAVNLEIEKLKATWEGKIREKKAINTPAARPSKTVLSQTSRGVGVPVQLDGSPMSELEVAVSKDTKKVLIASTSGLWFSINSGLAFTDGNRGVFPLRDPSLARGVSEKFYLSVVAEPTDTTGCAIAVSRSSETPKGLQFNLQGFSADCPNSVSDKCFPDQAHIAADSVTASPAGNDQLYAVWRHYWATAGVPDCREIDAGSPKAFISCSQDNGVTWKPADRILGAGDFPRVAVGLDGSVYVVTISGTTLLLNRFTSCANGLTPEGGFPVAIAMLTGTVRCPVPGLDRCNDGNTLSSPTVAPDPKDANHLFVAFAESDMTGGERIVVIESRNRGVNFPLRTTVSGPTSARRFMPWSCSTNGDAWVGWYDRRAATALNNDLTDYFIGSAKSKIGASPPLASGPIRNLTNNPDPQCASGWICPVRNAKDAEDCRPDKPQLAGICKNPISPGISSEVPCDFTTANGLLNGCPAGEICQTGGGCPRYGDYNGIACMGNFVFAAWASATAPLGLPAPNRIRVFASTEQVGTPAPAGPTNLGIGK